MSTCENRYILKFGFVHVFTFNNVIFSCNIHFSRLSMNLISTINFNVISYVASYFRDLI